MQQKILFIPLALFLLLIALFGWQLTRSEGGEDPGYLESVLIGKPVPSFRLTALEQPDRIYDQKVLADGHPLLLNIWASWCIACRVEHNYLSQLVQQGVRVVGLNYKDNRTSAIRWLNASANPYLLILYDGDGSLGLDLGVYGVPETFLIDGSGIIRYRHAGEINSRIWQQELKPLWDRYKE